MSNEDTVVSIFNAVSTRALRILAADYFALVIFDPDFGNGRLFINKRPDDLKVEELLGEIGAAAREFCLGDKMRREADGIPLTFDKDDFPPVAAFRRRLGCRKVLAVPCDIESYGCGFLVWAWERTPQDYTANTFDKAALITEQTALSLKLSLKEAIGRDSNAKLAALLELATAIYSSLNYKEVLEKAVQLSMDIVGADGGSIFILDKKSGILSPLVTIDPKHSEQIARIRLKIGEGLTGLVAKSGMGLISNQSHVDPRTIQVPGTPDDPESLICAPLTWSGEVIGVITLRSYRCKVFKQEDLDILTIFARQTADAIENAKLYESLEKAYQELANTQEQLIMTEKLRALGEMAGGVAHDFNNILGTILGRTQLLLRVVKDDRIAEHLRQIEKVTLAGAKTVQRMQNFTRVSSGGAYETIDLVRVIQDSIEMTRPRWKDECQKVGTIIELRYEHDSRLPVLGNSSELIEAFSNLILNSVDALPKGGVINIEAFSREQNAVIRIEDNGIGMDEATLKRIFFPFFTTKGKQGTGMGMSVAYGVIGRHKGEIDVSSKVGLGTTIVITLPLAKEIAREESQPPAAREVRKARILLIDDDDNIRNVISDMLEYMGHQVSSASAGDRGVELFRQQPFDLVITDLGMPGLSGWEVTRICKEIRPEIPVVMISGWGNQIDEETAAKGMLDAVLAKPFEMGKIKLLLDSVLSGSAGAADKNVSSPA